VHRPAANNALVLGRGLCLHARRPVITPSQPAAASRLPRANTAATDALMDSPLPGNSTALEKQQDGHQPRAIHREP
jgi:hypothetical protein